MIDPCDLARRLLPYVQSGMTVRQAFDQMRADETALFLYLTGATGDQEAKKQFAHLIARESILAQDEKEKSCTL